MPKKNVGGIDKTLRIILGLVIICLGIFYASWWGLFGVIILLTGILNRCGLYYLIGVNTCPVEKAPESTPPAATPPQV